MNNKLLIGLMILLVVGFVSGLCFTAADRINREVKIPKYDLTIRPGRVTYGTVSKAVVPMVSVSTPRSSMPMVSGGAVRAYAHSGHAIMPVMSSHRGSGYSTNYKLYTVSSAKVHSIGGGGAGGGGTAGSSTTSSSSSSNIRYSSSYATVSMPSLALASSSSSRLATVATAATTPSSDIAAASPRLKSGIRRVIDNGDGTYTGEYDGEYNDATGLYWNEEEEDWVDYPPVGTIKEEDGLIYEADGSGGWTLKGQVEDLGTPIGSTPWLLFLLLSLAYVLNRKAGWVGRKE